MMNMRRFLVKHLTPTAVDELAGEIDTTVGEIKFREDRRKSAKDALVRNDPGTMSHHDLIVATRFLKAGSPETALFYRAQQSQNKQEPSQFELLTIGQEALSMYPSQETIKKKGREVPGLQENDRVKEVLKGIICWVATHPSTPSYTVRALLRFRFVKMLCPEIVKNTREKKTIHRVLKFVEKWYEIQDNDEAIALELLTSTVWNSLMNPYTSTESLSLTLQIIENVDFEMGEISTFLEKIVCHPNVIERDVLKAVEEIANQDDGLNYDEKFLHYLRNGVPYRSVLDFLLRTGDSDALAEEFLSQFSVDDFLPILFTYSKFLEDEHFSSLVERIVNYIVSPNGKTLRTLVVNKFS
jgi:hypothetical protein